MVLKRLKAGITRRWKEYQRRQAEERKIRTKEEKELREIYREEYRKSRMEALREEVRRKAQAQARKGGRLAGLAGLGKGFMEYSRRVYQSGVFTGYKPPTPESLGLTVPKKRKEQPTPTVASLLGVAPGPSVREVKKRRKKRR